MSSEYPWCKDCNCFHVEDKHASHRDLEDRFRAGIAEGRPLHPSP